MRFKLVVLMFAVPGLAQAVICKTVGADGEVTYTDVPVEQCQNEVRLRGVSGYKPRPVTPTPAESAPAVSEPAPFTGYESLQIAQPEPDGTVRSNEGNMSVAVNLQPDLQPDHKLFISIDGRPVPGGFDATAVQLSGVERGSHRLRASVQDASGRELIAGAEVRFTMRKAGLNERAPGPPTIQPLPRPQSR